VKQKLSRQDLERMVLAEARGKWGCEDLTGVAIGRADPDAYGQNWQVTFMRNEQSKLCEQTVVEIATQLGRIYDLADD
jgi:hypothetical protein